MRQAQTLTDAQLRRVLHFCRSRRHPLRDETIILTSFYAGLRAIEIAALKYADVYDEQGAVRDQFTLRATQSKGGRTRTVYIGSKLKRALKEYQASIVMVLANKYAFVYVIPSKVRTFLSKHHVPAIPRYLQSMWSERCIKSLRTPHLHHQTCQQRCWSAVIGRTRRAFTYFDNPEIH